MNLQRLKIMFFISAVLISIAAFISFLAAPYLGSVYGVLVGDASEYLPQLTSQFSLPLLRVDPSAPLKYPATSWWASIVWALIILTPVLAFLWMLRAETVEKCLARWMGVLSIYFSIVMILFVTVISGLLIAVAPFPIMVLP